MRSALRPTARHALPFVVLMLVSLLTSAPLVYTEAAPLSPPEARQTGLYLALGDSIAAGIGASQPAVSGYAALLADRLDRQRAEPLQRINFAVPGATTASLLADGQLTWALRVLAAAERNGVPLASITVTIGGNDLLLAGADPAARAAALRTVGANLAALLARLGAATSDPTGRPTTPIVVTGYYDPTGTPKDGPAADGWWLARLDGVIARETRRAGATWVDVATAFAGREDRLTWYPRDVHPTDAGHRAIADAIWHAVAATEAANGGNP